MTTFPSSTCDIGDLRIEGDTGSVAIVSNAGFQTRVWGRFHDRHEAETALAAEGAFMRECHSRWVAEVEIHQRIAADLLAA